MSDKTKKKKANRPARGHAENLAGVRKVKLKGKEYYVVIYKRVGSKNPRGYTANVVKSTIWEGDKKKKSNSKKKKKK